MERKGGTVLKPDSVVLITGGSSGIGRATALAFAREGAKVAIADVSVERCEQTVDEIRATGGEATCMECDVSDPEEVNAMVHEVVNVFGRLDYAFNNAGVEGVQAPVAEYPKKTWDVVLGVNLTGVWLCMKHEIIQMVKQGGGAIVNMSSILGVTGTENACAYVAAKHGVVGVTKAAALEYASQGIRINAVCPGYIDTPMLERAGVTLNEESRRSLAELHALGRLGTSEEVAEAVLWLCSEQASFVTGHAMLIDGGYTAR
jgi:NAD(P)-dependent dehydrogenase (short-subunit alcohol dehydrogenase family)